MDTVVNPLGSHILLTLHVSESRKLVDFRGFQNFSETVLRENNLEKVGFVSHVFDNKSFTAAICLMESHICIHTWPENQNLALDIYLCNYSQDNSEKIRKVADEFVNYFDAEILKQIIVER